MPASLEKSLTTILENCNAASVLKIGMAWFEGKPPAKRVNELIPKLVDEMKVTNKNKIERICELSNLQRAALNIAKKQISASTLLTLLQSEGYTDVQKPVYDLVCKGFMLTIGDDSYSKVDFSAAKPDIFFSYSSYKVITLPCLQSTISAPSQIKEKFANIPENNIKRVITPRLHELLEGLERLDSLLLKKKIQITKTGMIRSNQRTVIEREITSTGGWGFASMIVEAALASQRVVEDNSCILRPNSSQNELSLMNKVKNLFFSFANRAHWADDTNEATEDAVLSFLQESYGNPQKESIISGRCFLVKTLIRLENRGWVSLDEFIERVLELFSNILFPPNRYSYYRYRHNNDEKDEKKDAYEQAVQHEFIRCFIGRTCFRFGLIEIGLLKDTGSLIIPVVVIVLVNQVNSEYPSRSR